MQAPIRKRPPEVHFVFLGNKEVWSIFKMCPMTSVLFSKKCHLFNNFVFGSLSPHPTNNTVLETIC